MFVKVTKTTKGSKNIFPYKICRKREKLIQILFLFSPCLIICCSWKSWKKGRSNNWDIRPWRKVLTRSKCQLMNKIKTNLFFSFSLFLLFLCTASIVVLLIMSVVPSLFEIAEPVIRVWVYYVRSSSPFSGVLKIIKDTQVKYFDEGDRDDTVWVPSFDQGICTLEKGRHFPFFFCFFGTR